jgi:DNA repair ATPase RecN
MSDNIVVDVAVLKTELAHVRHSVDESTEATKEQTKVFRDILKTLDSRLHEAEKLAEANQKKINATQSQVATINSRLDIIDSIQKKYKWFVSGAAAAATTMTTAFFYILKTFVL